MTAYEMGFYELPREASTETVGPYFEDGDNAVALEFLLATATVE